MVLAQTPVLLCGVTGTGKTKSTLDLLQRKFNDVEYCNMHLTYSCSTEVNAVQRAIEGRVSARRRKGYYGPEDGKKGCVVFVDDLGMPTKEVYGAQPPIELLR
jgi:dynein heavy chain